MKIVFAKLAKLELEDAIAYYELEQYAGLGIRFKYEVKQSLDR